MASFCAPHVAKACQLQRQLKYIKRLIAPQSPYDQRMQTRQVNVANDLGLHARLAAQVVHVSSRFRSRVSLAFKGRKASAQNVLAVMLLAASVGSTILIEATGPDELEAIDALTSLIGDPSR